MTFKVDMIKGVYFEPCYDWLIGKSAYQLNPYWTNKCKPRILVILGVRYPSAVVMILLILYLLSKQTLYDYKKKEKGIHTANEIQRIVFSLTLSANQNQSYGLCIIKVKQF